MNCLPLTVLLKNNCRGLPAASNDAVVSAKCDGVLKAGVRVGRRPPMTQRLSRFAGGCFDSYKKVDRDGVESGALWAL